MKNMKNKPTLIVVVLLVVVFGGLFGGRAWVNYRAAEAAAARGAPVTTVSTVQAATEHWTPDVHVVGSLQAEEGVQLTAQIAGNVTAINFKSGDKVEKGRLLVQLDDGTELAQLHADQAKEKQAQAEAARTQDLIGVKAASQSDLDTAEANYGSAQSAVESDQATLRKLDIAAPFSGMTGIRQVSLGQYVAPGTVIVSLQSWDPMHLEFTIPQAEAMDLHTGQKAEFSVDALPNRKFTGDITAVDSRIDPATRNVGVEATLANRESLLRPGMYGDVHLSLGKDRDVVIIPSVAVTYNTFGNFVYVVSADPQSGVQVVHQRMIVTGDERQGKVVVESGLKAGETVVTAGQTKLHEGSHIAVNNVVQP
ncbi:MAG TPA: efflux RND transporter periplasmic adaptor subunit [Gammaproteobacteria bacterium]|nr:efflux RND transporter periplasmic adaptor subunit [Gammaproteobacteria bacterium]